ncbi:hypothetical protein [Microviridae sp.]|nr:hypothetical protein [Microviridae sp.]
MNVNEKIVDQEEVNSATPHRFVFQFIDKETGHRSEPFLSDWTELKKILELREEQENAKPTDEDYILLVAVMDKQQTHIPTSPLLTVGSYLKTMGATPNE